MRTRIRKFGFWASVFGLVVSCGSETASSAFDNYDVAYLKIQSDLTYDFGLIATGTAKSAMFTIENTGRAYASSIEGTFSVSSFRYSGGTYPGTQGTCTNRLGPGAQCIIQVEFAPSFPTTFQDQLRLIYFDGNSTTNSDASIPQCLLKGRGM